MNSRGRLQDSAAQVRDDDVLPTRSPSIRLRHGQVLWLLTELGADVILRGIASHREQLYRFYRRAYAERRSGAGKSILIITEDCRPIELRGLYLDLNIEFAGGRLVRFGPPKLLSSTETLLRFSKNAVSGRAFLPLALSLLSERVAALALRAPEIRSGPPKSSISAARLKMRRSK
jgi:hypothetical protein